MQVTGNNIQNNNKSIRFSTGGLSFCVNGKCKSIIFDKSDDDFHKSIAICLCENSLNDSCTDIWDIYIDNPYYTIIPKEIADKDICISAFKLNFPEINSNHIIMSEDIDRHNMISTFGIHKGLYDFIKKQFPLHKIHHYSLSNMVKSIEHSKNSGSKEVWANVSNNSIFINLVDNGKLLLTNSFNVKKPTDSLYYIGSVYEQFNLSTKNTELYFCGDNEHFSLLKKHISLSNNISDLCEL
ncbi:MAG: DUF3822 family protein [Paludibacteraceae bacterium]|nr:DUF3822 family protein [Paludibacteraceae bacterium]MBR6686132.1 DUF3822 family protein [Paludibacteraceae bacterium]